MKVSSALLLVILGVFSLCLADDGYTDQNSSEIIDSDLHKAVGKEEEDFSKFLKLQVKKGYLENQLYFISDTVDTLKAEQGSMPNLTLIGYQNIYDENGPIKEIRTIELAVPRLEANSSVCCSADDNGFDHKDPELLQEIRDFIEKLASVALGVEYSYQGIKDRIYIGKDLAVMEIDGNFLVNKSIHVETLADVEEDCKKINTSGQIPLSYLVYDQERKFVKSKSIAAPEMFVQVDSEFEKPNVEIVETSLQSLANAFLESENKDDVPERVRQKLEEHYPELIFTVTSNKPVGIYINEDFSIHMHFRSFYFEDVFAYSVYGYNQTS